MEIFLSVVQTISDNWIWIGPIAAACVLVLVVRETIAIFRAIHEDMMKD